MANSDRWYLPEEKIFNTPSRKCGFSAEKELECRQQASNLIQDMGRRCEVSQLAINTAIVYMHRFYMLHSLMEFHKYSIATCALFLACKVEEQPRKMEYVIRAERAALNLSEARPDVKSEEYAKQARQLIMNEIIMLQSLGFDIEVDHPHTHILSSPISKVATHKELIQTAYFLATNSLHLTMWCVRYKPKVVACVCIKLALAWTKYSLPNEIKDWWQLIDPDVTEVLLDRLSHDLITICDKVPTKLKKMNNLMKEQIKSQQAVHHALPAHHPPHRNLDIEIRAHSPTPISESKDKQSPVKPVLPATTKVQAPYPAGPVAEVAPKSSSKSIPFSEYKERMAKRLPPPPQTFDSVARDSSHNHSKLDAHSKHGHPNHRPHSKPDVHHVRSDGRRSRPDGHSLQYDVSKSDGHHHGVDVHSRVEDHHLRHEGHHHPRVDDHQTHPEDHHLRHEGTHSRLDGQHSRPDSLKLDGHHRPSSHHPSRPSHSKPDSRRSRPDGVKPEMGLSKSVELQRLKPGVHRPRPDSHHVGKEDLAIRKQVISKADSGAAQQSSLKLDSRELKTDGSYKYGDGHPRPDVARFKHESEHWKNRPENPDLGQGLHPKHEIHGANPDGSKSSESRLKVSSHHQPSGQGEKPKFDLYRKPELHNSSRTNAPRMRPVERVYLKAELPQGYGEPPLPKAEKQDPLPKLCDVGDQVFQCAKPSSVKPQVKDHDGLSSNEGCDSPLPPNLLTRSLPPSLPKLANSQAWTAKFGVIKRLASVEPGEIVDSPEQLRSESPSIPDTAAALNNGHSPCSRHVSEEKVLPKTTDPPAVTVHTDDAQNKVPVPPEPLLPQHTSLLSTSKPSLIVHLPLESRSGERLSFGAERKQVFVSAAPNPRNDSAIASPVTEAAPLRMKISLNGPSLDHHRKHSKKHKKEHKKHKKHKQKTRHSHPDSPFHLKRRLDDSSDACDTPPAKIRVFHSQ